MGEHPNILIACKYILEETGSLKGLDKKKNTAWILQLGHATAVNNE